MFRISYLGCIQKCTVIANVLSWIPVPNDICQQGVHGKTLAPVTCTSECSPGLICTVYTYLKGQHYNKKNPAKSYVSRVCAPQDLQRLLLIYWTDISDDPVTFMVVLCYFYASVKWKINTGMAIYSIRIICHGFYGKCFIIQFAL